MDNNIIEFRQRTENESFPRIQEKDIIFKLIKPNSKQGKNRVLFTVPFVSFTKNNIINFKERK